MHRLIPDDVCSVSAIRGRWIVVRRLAFGSLLVAWLACPGFDPGIAAPAPAQKPTLSLKPALSSDKAGKSQLFIFEGTFPTSVHRSGPEHFKLTRVSDGERVSLTVAYDKEDLEHGDAREKGDQQKEVVKRVRPARNVLVYNHLFKGVRLSLDTGRFDAKDMQGHADLLDLYGRAKLEPGARYRLTWACWPVGAREAAEVSCDFEMTK
jgi:hypothetical protein